MKVEKIITKDNSPTLYVPKLDEHYHSVNGAMQESKHIFIDSGLESINKKKINILEIGFGTGLNAVLSYETAKRKQIEIYYEAIEKYPLSKEIIDDIEFQYIDKDFFKLIHRSKWENERSLNKFFSLKKIEVDLKDFIPDKNFDLIYFDAFAPEKQPSLWTEEIFKKLYDHTNQKGILVTYSSKGIVKQALRNVGYSVKRLQGPPGKRHMVLATKNI